MALIIQRILAALIDLVIILIYATALLALSMVFFRQVGTQPQITDPFLGQIIGFFTLTLPVFLYFYLSEKGIQRATFGKKRMRIRVAGKDTAFAPPLHIFMRTLLKLLPWEIAHTGVHQVVNGSDPESVWVYMLLIVPQIVALAYLGSAFFFKGESSLYDEWAQTQIVREEY